MIKWHYLEAECPNCGWVLKSNDPEEIEDLKFLLDKKKLFCIMCGGIMHLKNGRGSRANEVPVSSPPFFEKEVLPPPAASPPSVDKDSLNRVVDELVKITKRGMKEG